MGAGPSRPLWGGYVTEQVLGATPGQFAGIAQLIERQPSKLRVVGLSPTSRSKNKPIHCRVVGGSARQMVATDHGSQSETGVFNVELACKIVWPGLTPIGIAFSPVT